MSAGWNIRRSTSTMNKVLKIIVTGVGSMT